MLESLDETLWELFRHTGSPQYYTMYRAVKNTKEVENAEREVHGDMP